MTGPGWSVTAAPTSFEGARAAGRVHALGEAPPDEPIPLRAPAPCGPLPRGWDAMRFTPFAPEYMVLENALVIAAGTAIEGNDAYLHDATFQLEPRSREEAATRHRLHLAHLGAEATEEGFRKSFGEEPPFRAGTHLMLVANHPFNFGHFVHDVLPRFHILAGLPEALRQGCILLTDRLRFPMQHRLVAGFADGHPVVALGRNGAVRVERLIVPRNALSSASMCLPALAHARARMQEIAGATAPPARPRAIYVSRRHSAKTHPSRRLDNLAALDALLAEFGFEEILCERLSVEEQWALFRETTVMIGQHGAGMMNQFFLPEGAAVIEITGRPKPNGTPTTPAWIVAMSQQLGLGGYFSVPVMRGEEAHADLDGLRRIFTHLRRLGKLPR